MTIDTQQISKDVLKDKYCKNGETTVEDVYKRVAKGVAKAESAEKQQEWEDAFYKNMHEGAIGAGRIMSAAGSDIQATLINCFSGETKALTPEGYKELKELVGESTKVFSIDGWRDATFKNFGKQKLYKITFAGNHVHYATLDHRWLSTGIIPMITKAEDLKETTTKDLAGQYIPAVGSIPAVNVDIRANHLKRLGFIKVLTVEETDREEDVYCAIEPVTQTFTIEGNIITRNCFVEPVGDSIKDIDSEGNPGIYSALLEAAETMKRGGGVGYNFSHIRPKNAFVKSVGSFSSGPCSYIDIFNTSCATIESAGSRRGAQMGILDINHPDILEFVKAKRTPGRWNNFNVSVMVTDEFMLAKNGKKPFQLIHEAKPSSMLINKGAFQREDGMWVYETIDANVLWDTIMQSNYDYAEPGILFRDTINNDNNLKYVERIDATNPCVTIDTWVMTSDGPKQVRDLIDTPYKAIVDGVPYESKTGFYFTGKKPIFRVKTTDGYTLKLTDNHLLFKLAGKFEGKNVYAETAVADLKPIDLLRLNDHRKALSWDGYGTVNEGFLLGSFLLKTPVALKMDINKIQVILEDLHIDPNSSDAITQVEKTSKSFYIGFLNAVFDSFSTVSISNNELFINLKYSDYSIIEIVQRMLLRLGIVCTRKNTEITIVNSNIIRFYTEVGFTDETKDAIINSYIKQNKDTIKKETFVSAIDSITQQATEELVYDTTVEDIHIFDANGFHAHNCAEEPLPPYGCCDLGPINLTKFVKNPFTPEAHFDYEKFKSAVAIQVRFLDNVLEVTLWPLEQQRIEAMNKRRIGVGYTGLGNVLAMLGLHYDSEVGRLTAKTIATCMRDTAYNASIDLAIEKGEFPLLEKEKYLTDTFASRLPDHIKDRIRTYGIRNSHLLSIAPTGCCVPSTMIITSNGLQTIGSLQNNTNDVWQDIDISVKTDSGFKHSDKFYINGERPVITIEDSYGFTISATDNHQLRIINSNGEYVWRRMDEMVEGDVIVKCLDGYPTDIVDKLSVDANITSKTTKPTFIKKGLTYSKEMAEFVGFLMSNGNIKTDRHIRLYHHVMYADKTLAYFKDVLENTFNLDQTAITTPFGEQQINVRELSIHSGDLINWLKQNDAYKTGSRGLKIPNWVLTGSREVIYGFLRGLYEGDGSGNMLSITYTSVDREFINKLQILLSSIGILTRKDIGRKANSVGAFGVSPVYRLSIGNRIDKFRFMTKIGFISHKGEKCKILPEWENIQRTLFGNASKTINKAFGHIKDKQDIDSFKKLNGITEEIMFSEVRNIYYGRGSMTVDISVPENVTYLANSFVSHNTVSLAFCDNASNGIEPPYSLAYVRKKRENDGTMKSYPVIDYGFRVWLETQEPKEAEQILEAVCNYRDHILVGDDKKKVLLKELLPESLVTALELSVDGHLGILRVTQPYIDSSVSKTLNVPVDYPFEDFKTIYDKAWEYKLKGVATYRPNDILGSVLSVPVETKKEVKVEEPTKDVKTIDPYTVAYPRRPLGDFPSITRKIVYTGATGDVSLFLTVSFINTYGQVDEQTLMVERPLEVFIVVPPDDVPVEWVTAYAKNLSLIARSSLSLLVKALQDGRSIKSDKGQIRYGWFNKDDGSRVPRFHSSEVGVIAYAIQELLFSKQILDEEGNLIPLRNSNLVVNCVGNDKQEKINKENTNTSEPKLTNGNSVIRTNKVCKHCGASAVIKRDGCSFCTNCNVPGDCG